MRFGVIFPGSILGAVLMLALVSGTPASANTIATFQLNNVTFDDGGTAIGTFSMDISGGAIHSSITTTAGVPADEFLGWSYYPGVFISYDPPAFVFVIVNPDGSLNPDGTVKTIGLFLNFDFSMTTDLSSLPSFTLTGAEGFIDRFNCSTFFPCINRAITGGSIQTLSLQEVATTPIPAALPLFASALGGLGFFGWRRHQKSVAE
jgi:hypothetical protein